MSHTNTQLPVLTDKQRAWANAFLRVLGGQGEVKATAPTPQSPRSRGVTPPPELKDGLDTLDREVNQPLREQRDKLAGVGEDIRRKKLVGYSADKGYKKDVSGEVDKILIAVDTALARGGAVNDTTVPLLAGLREKLAQAQKDYTEGMVGERDVKKRDQRGVKADAIAKRLDALDKLITASNLAQTERMNKIAELEPDEQAQMLAANPELMRAIVAAKPAPDKIADILSAMKDGDALVEQLVAAHGGDAAYMDALCERVLGNELPKKATKDGNTFMRGNTAASKLTKAYAMSGETQGFMGELAENSQVWLKPSRKIEIDPNKEPSKGKRDTAVGELIGYVRALLNAVVGKEVPRPIATTASMIAAGARKTGMGDGDVAIMVGGHVFLRLINPMLVSMPGLDSNQRRSMILATKVLQNASNGVTTSVKEPFMDAFADYIDGELPTLHQWFLDIARQGDEVLGLDGLDDPLAMGAGTNRSSLIDHLEDPSYDPAPNFADPTQEDPLGLAPAAPTTRIGKLIAAAVALKPQAQGIGLPIDERGRASHAKVVARARREMIARVVDRLKRDAPSQD